MHVEHATLEQMRDGGLAPDALLVADQHLAECDACRARLAVVVAATSSHLAPEDISALASGSGSLEAQSHVGHCRQCAADVRALAEFAGDVDAYTTRRSRMVGRIAAGVAAAVVVASSAWWLSRGATRDTAIMASIESAPTALPKPVAAEWNVPAGRLTPAAAVDAAACAVAERVLARVGGLP
jgi:hypothetical protein